LPELHSLRVAVTLPCRRCGYDIRGLRADGQCPECGLGIVESIAAVVDPDIALLPPLPRGRAAAASLLVLTAAMAVAAIAASLAYAAQAIAGAPPGGWRDTLMHLLPPDLARRLPPIPPLAIAVAILAAAALLSASATAVDSRPGTTRPPRPLLLFLGLGGWLAAACLPIEPVSLALCGATSGVALLGLGPLVTELGRRSRTYRERTAARQAVGPVLTAIVVGVLATAIGIVVEGELSADAAAPFHIAATACLGMTVIGFVYLVVNAVWIWAALRAWQPVLSRMVDRPEDDGPPEQMA
jgi:hypothetical protein